MNVDIDRAIASREWGALVRALEGAGTSTLRYAVARIEKVEDGVEAALSRCAEWAHCEEPSTRRLACLLTVAGYGENPDASFVLLHDLADDDDASVRGEACVSCGRLLRNQFSSVCSRLEPWRRDPSPHVRRAVAAAVARTADRQRLEWAEPLLRLILPLFADADPSVRRQVGPSALGSLLHHYPVLTFEVLVNGSTSSDAQVLWTVAMAFTSPAAADMAKRAVIVLRKLALDERRYVWRAAATAMWKLARRRPDVVRPELARWLEDESRVHVAREALRFL